MSLAIDPACMGGKTRHKAEREAGVASHVSFILTTSFMVWATTQRYSHTAAGLMACYAAGLPFCKNKILGGAFYTFDISGGYAAISQFVRRRQQVA